MAFRPQTLPEDLITGLALAPPVAAGLLLFHVVAAEMLGAALVVGAFAHAAARLARQPLAMSPVVPALFGVALIGPGAPVVWSVAVSSLAVAIELARARLHPALRLQSGLAAYAILYLAGHGAPAAYLHPPDLQAYPEPIRLWLGFFSGGAAPIDPVRLYVGNVAGPVFATSLLAVVVGAAWLWYARRLDLGVPAGFAIGGIAVSVAMHWDPVYQLASGPAWFAACLILADRRLLPMSAPPIALTLMGLVAGAVGVGLRTRGYGIEALFVTVAVIQAGQAAFQGLGRLIAYRERLARYLDRVGLALTLAPLRAAMHRFRGHSQPSG